MDASNWLESLRRQLREQGTSPAEIDRLTEELNDHFHDLKEEIMLTETDAVTRMGPPEQIALASRPRRSRTALAIALFALSPIVMIFVVALADLYVVGMLLDFLGGDAYDETALSESAKMAMQYSVTILAIFLPPILLSVFYWHAAKWLNLSRRWPVTSVVIMTVIAGLATCQMTFQDSTSHGSITFGLGIGQWRAMQALQVAVPVAFAWWLMRRRERNVLAG